jgi:hypothetical protein
MERRKGESEGRFAGGYRVRLMRGWQEKVGKTLYRNMQETSDGEPAIGPSARALGARPHVDIPVDPSGSVHPGTGGMSVAPDTPSNLPRHRRPPEHGGTGKDPLWSIQERALGVHLRYVADAVPVPTHGVIEPTILMPFAAYQHALAETAPYWARR